MEARSRQTSQPRQGRQASSGRGSWPVPVGQPARRTRVERQRRQKVARRVDLTVEQKHQYCQAMAVQFRETGASRKWMFEHWAREVGCTAQTMRKVWDHKLLWQQRVELTGGRAGVAPRGHISGRPVGRPARLRAGQKAATGRRLPGPRCYLGNTDPLRAERQALKAWGHAEEGCRRGVCR